MKKVKFARLASLTTAAIACTALAGCVQVKEKDAANKPTKVEVVSPKTSAVTVNKKVVVPASPKTDVVVADPNYNSHKDDALVKAEMLNGNWKISTDAAGHEGQEGQLIFSQTKVGDRQMVSSRGCVGDLANVASWKIDKDEVLLYDKDGKLVVPLDVQDAPLVIKNATYHKPYVLNFIGHTSDNQNVVVTR